MNPVYKEAAYRTIQQDSTVTRADTLGVSEGRAIAIKNMVLEGKKVTTTLANFGASIKGVLPCASATVTVMVCKPEASGTSVVQLQAPLESATAVHNTASPANGASRPSPGTLTLER